MSLLADQELVFHTSSGGDSNGRLFTWNGSLYRGVPHASAPLYERLFRDGIVDTLRRKQLLIDSEIADLPTASYPLVVRHRRIPAVSYPVEWSQGMLRQAALLIVDLETELAPHGLSIHDAHPWNVVFDGPRPFFVDLGAIMPLEDSSVYDFPRDHPYWPAYGQFCSTLLHPLIAMSWGYASIARASLLDYVGVSEHELGKLAPWRALGTRWFWHWSLRRVSTKTAALLERAGSRIPAVRTALDARRTKTHTIRNRTAGSYGGMLPLRDRMRFLNRLRHRIEAVAPTTAFGGALRALDGARQNGVQPHRARAPGRAGRVTSENNRTDHSQSIADVLSTLRPASVLDLRCGDGSYALLAAQAGARVIACDVDEVCVESLYRTARRQSIDLLPLRIDPRSPTPGVGPCNEWLLPATERLRCEMVFAVALVQPLVFGHYMTFDQIARTLDRFSSRWAVVEFVLPDDDELGAMRRPGFGWYTRENLEASLRRYFPHVEVLNSYRKCRSLLLLEKPAGR